MMEDVIRNAIIHKNLQIGEMNMRLANMTARRDELLALVLAVEWVPDPGDMGDPDYCPWCYGTKPNHTIACEREATIAKAQGD